MTAGIRTFSIEETLLEPPALPAPPTRRALFVILIALAALLHVATIGSGDLYSQTEGQYAGSRHITGSCPLMTASRACKNRRCSIGSLFFRSSSSALMRLPRDFQLRLR